MDPSVLLMLSNLLHLHNHLDPLLSDTLAAASATPNSSTPSPSPPSSSSAPLLFFAIASVLSYASSTLSRPPSPPPPSSSSSPSLAAFRSLSSSPSLDPFTRDARWRSLYGISFPVFHSLLRHLHPLLRRSPSLPPSLPPDFALSIALSRLSRGLSLRSLSRSHSLPTHLISRLTNTVTRLLATNLYSHYVKIPSGHRLLQTIQSFKDLTSLPNIAGAIDSSPIKLKRSPDNPEPYHCRYGYAAVLLQVVSDHRKIFWDVCIKAPGSVDDASHFRDSQLYARLMSGDILQDAVLAVRGHHAKPYIVGGWAYPLLSFLITPFTPDRMGTTTQNGFDAAVMRGRAASVEAAIGLLKGRWRILRELDVGTEHAAQTVVACCVLHNMCQLNGEPEDESMFGWKEPKENGPVSRVLDNEKSFHQFGESLRQVMADDLHDRQQRHSTGGRGR